MNHYAHNLEVCKKYMPVLAQKLEMENCGTGALKIGGENTEWVIAGSRGTFKRGNGGEVASQLRKKSLIILYGMGDGEYLTEILRNSCDHEIIIFEPFVGFIRDLFKQKDLTHILCNPHVEIIVGGDDSRYLEEMRQSMIKNVRRYILAGNHANMMTLGYEKVPGFKESALSFAQSFRTSVDNFSVEMNTSPEGALRGLFNSLDNAEIMGKAPGIDSLKGTMHGVPGILVASGPSLKSAIPYLKKISDRNAFIICCDSTLGALLNEGIVPHMVTCMERVRETAELFKGVTIPPDCYLAAPPLITRETLGLFGKNVFRVCRDAAFDRLLFPASPRHHIGITSASMALEVLRIVGCTQVYLVGLDGAYEPGSLSSHAEACPDIIRSHGQRIRNDGEGVSNFHVKGYDGQDKLTMSYWYLNMQWFAEMKLRHGLDMYHVIAENYGIPISGAKRLNPETLADLPLPTLNHGTGIRDVLAKKNQAADGDAFSYQVVESTILYLSELMRLCLDTMEEISLYSFNNRPNIANNTDKYPEFFSRMESVQEKLFSDEKNFQTIVGPLLANVLARKLHHYYSVRDDLSQDKAVCVQKRTDLMMDWFECLYTWCSRYKHYLDRVLRGNQ